MILENLQDDLNLRILRWFEDPFSLDTTHIKEMPELRNKHFQSMEYGLNVTKGNHTQALYLKQTDMKRKSTTWYINDPNKMTDDCNVQPLSIQYY